MRPARHLTAAAMAALIAPALAAAETAPSPDIAGAAAASEADTVVVTANRSPRDIERVGQSVTVLTGEAIRLDQETSVADILARTPGVNVARTGGAGQPASVFIRGADSDHTVVLIDGVKVNDPSTTGGAYDFANLITGDAARIEVLRGPQSTLYGSEAIGGVVNYVTADATRPLQGDLQAEGGSYGTAYVRGGIGGRDGPATFRLGAYYNSTDGVSAVDRAYGGREDDGFHTAGASGRFTYDLTPDLQFDERAYYTWSRAEFDGYDTPIPAGALYSNFGDDDEFARVQQVVDYTGLNLSLFDGRLKNRIAYTYNELDRRNEEPDGAYGPKSTFDGLGRVNGFDYEGTFAVAPGYTAVFGAQDERSSFNTSSYGGAPTKANKSIASGYGQVTGEVVHGLTLTGGVRDDEDSAFGGHVTGQASAAWRVASGTILRASYGGGFKAPSLFQLYSVYGNLALRPETANGWDAGVEQHLFADRLVLQATYFGRRTNNLIDYADPTAQHPYGYYVNVGRAEAEGVELQADLRPVTGLDIAANYTFDDDEDRTAGSSTRGQQLDRRPKNTANLSATYTWPDRLSTTVAVRYAGRSLDEGGYVTLGDYTLVDLRASYPLTDQLELYGRVENLADKAYETAYQYGALGRAAYGGVRVRF